MQLREKEKGIKSIQVIDEVTGRIHNYPVHEVVVSKIGSTGFKVYSMTKFGYGDPKVYYGPFIFELESPEVAEQLIDAINLVMTFGEDKLEEIVKDLSNAFIF